VSEFHLLRFPPTAPEDFIDGDVAQGQEFFTVLELVRKPGLVPVELRGRLRHHDADAVRFTIRMPPKIPKEEGPSRTKIPGEYLDLSTHWIGENKTHILRLDPNGALHEDTPGSRDETGSWSLVGRRLTLEYPSPQRTMTGIVFEDVILLEGLGYRGTVFKRR
jgi:hypothetical protein